MAKKGMAGEVTRASSKNRCDGMEIITYFHAGNEIAREVLDETGKSLVLAGYIPDGMVAEYYCSGTLKRRYVYLNNKPHGLSREYYPGTRLVRAEQYFVNGLLEGPSHTFYRNGQLWEDCTFKSGKLHGFYRSYHDNGDPDIQAHYRDGQLDGEYRSYSRHGLPRETGFFREGKRDRLRTIYCETGEKKYVDTYRDGRIVLRQKFDNEGDLVAALSEPIEELEAERAREAERFVSEGIEFSNMGCYHRAIEAFRRAIDAKPDFVEAYFRLASAYSSQGLYREHADTLNRVLAFEPNHPRVCFRIAVSHIITGNRAEAILEHEILKGLNEEYAEGLSHLLSN